MLAWRKILSWQFNDYSELKKVLDKKRYTYEDLGNELIINHKGNINLYSITFLPDNIQFNNGGNIYLDSLTSLPDNIQFNNGGNVSLGKLRSLPNNKYEIFHNKGIVYYNWNGDSYTKFNPNQRNASLKFSWKLPNIKVGDRVRVIASEKLLSILDSWWYGDKIEIEGKEGKVIDIVFEKRLSWSDPEYSGGVVVYFPELSRNLGFPYSHWQDFLEVIKTNESSLKLSWQLYTEFTFDEKEYVLKQLNEDLYKELVNDLTHSLYNDEEYVSILQLTYQQILSLENINKEELVKWDGIFIAERYSYAFGSIYDLVGANRLGEAEVIEPSYLDSLEGYIYNIKKIFSQ